MVREIYDDYVTDNYIDSYPSVLMNGASFDHYSQKANISTVISDANGVSVCAEQYVRPSITLKPGTSFVSGNGSIDNPYIIE